MNLRIRKLTPKELLFYVMGLCGIIDNVGEQLYEERFRKILPILWQEIGKEEIWKEIRRFWCIQQKEILQPSLYEQSIYNDWNEYSNKQSGTPIFKNDSEKNIELSESLFNLWESWKSRYTPHRWELSQQQFQQFNSFMSQLSHETTQEEKDLYNLWETYKGFELLQQALYKVQEIWQSTIPQEQSQGRLRIRKLVPKECLLLMGFSKDDYQAMKDIGMSDMQIYHCAGDSLVTTVCAMLFGQMLQISEEELKSKVEKYVDSLTIR